MMIELTGCVSAPVARFLSFIAGNGRAAIDPATTGLLSRSKFQKRPTMAGLHWFSSLDRKLRRY